jgi:hypothetical protein
MVLHSIDPGQLCRVWGSVLLLLLLLLQVSIRGQLPKLLQHFIHLLIHSADQLIALFCCCCCCCHCYSCCCCHPGLGPTFLIQPLILNYFRDLSQPAAAAAARMTLIIQWA